MNYWNSANRFLGLMEIGLANFPGYFLFSQPEMYQRISSDDFPVLSKVVDVGIMAIFYGLAAAGSVDGVRRIFKRN